MDVAETAKVLAALGHEGRLLIFRLLVAAGAEGLPAGEVARRTGQLQNTTSSNLSILAAVGLVSARRAGRSVIYAVAHTRFGEALEFVTQDFLADQPETRAAFFQRLLKAASAGGAYEQREVRGNSAA